MDSYNELLLKVKSQQKDIEELVSVIKLVRKHGSNNGAIPYLPNEVVDNLIAKHPRGI